MLSGRPRPRRRRWCRGLPDPAGQLGTVSVKHSATLCRCFAPGRSPLDDIRPPADGSRHFGTPLSHGRIRTKSISSVFVRRGIAVSWLPKKIKLTPSLVALLLANAVMLVGVVFFGWQIFVIMLLFWSENVIIGFYTM
ncbi:MAG: DUF6498-containing protein, partial [Planctomycetota bacterium]